VIAPIIQLAAVLKDYHGLRPLRIESFTLAGNEHAAILGLDAASAEVLVNLLTGAILPDSGSVALFGTPTGEVTDSAEWLRLVDRVGIVSDRAALLEPLSALQNIALPQSIEIEPLTPPAREAAVALARETGLSGSMCERPVSELTAPDRLRVRVARALALDPSVVLLEHPSASLEASDARVIATEIRALFDRRGASSLTLGADGRFASAVADRVLTLDHSSGRLAPVRDPWFRRPFR
jgi:ABC-type transporter Mla maintaining outer membrane lipid asymmetry ATPase subunit MlaF